MRLSSRHDTTVVMVGDTKVGKTALVNKFRAGKFDSSYTRTNFESVTTSSIVGGQRVKFTIYDTSGMQKYLMTRSTKTICCLIKYSRIREAQLTLAHFSSLPGVNSCLSKIFSVMNSQIFSAMNSKNILLQATADPTQRERSPIVRRTCSCSATR